MMTIKIMSLQSILTNGVSWMQMLRGEKPKKSYELATMVFQTILSVDQLLIYTPGWMWIVLNTMAAMHSTIWMALEWI